MPKLVDNAGAEVGTNSNPIVTSKLKKTTTYGSYYFHSGNLAIVAAAHGATVGFLYIYNPVSSGKNARIASIKMITGMVTALATPTAPRVTVERGTFTGTPSGTQIAVAKGDSTDANSVLYISAASTGATNGTPTPIGGKLVDANATGTVNTNSSESMVLPIGEDVKDLVLRPGEYLVIRQADAGTASDTRKAMVDMIYEEFI
jgi:hypothetical protein